MRVIPDKVIVRCDSCKQKLSLPYSLGKKLKATCPKCKSTFIFDPKKYRAKHLSTISALLLIILTLISVIIVIPFVLGPDMQELKTKYDSEHEANKNAYIAEINLLNQQHAERIAAINVSELREKAEAHYRKLWHDRKNYDAKYALSPREKAQLKMVTLTKQKIKPLRDIIKEIAREAAPKNSEIEVYGATKGMKLHIDFHMSALTYGEEGTRTKHESVASLKNEVLTLIARVTSDIYQFCQDMDLISIHIGCKHWVRTTYGSSHSDDEDLVLYKIRLDKKDIKEMTHNPFLDVYSTKKYFKVEIDNFSDLSITRTPI